MSTEERSLSDTVRDVIAEELGLQPQDVELDSSLAALGAESLDRAAVILSLENVVGVEIPNDDADKFVTVRDVVDYLWGRLKQ